MTFGVLLLVLTAAFCHAGWNFLTKRIRGGAELVWMYSILSSVIYLPLAAWVFFNLESSLTPLHWLFIAGSTVLHLIYFVSLQAAYRHGDLSVVYPTARSMGPLVAMILAVVVLSEFPTVQGAIGAAIILSGVFALTCAPGSSWAIDGRSVLFGVWVGCLIGSYTTWDAYAVATIGVAPLILEYGINIGRTILLMPTAIRRRRAIAGHWRDHKISVLGISVLMPLAYLLVLFALQTTPVVYVAPLREVSVLLTVLAGSLLLGEGHLRHRLSWSAVIFVGVVTLATS